MVLSFSCMGEHIMRLMTLALAFMLTGMGFLAGCSHQSVIQQRDGSQTVTPDEPKYNKKSGFFEYEENGRKVRINKDNVKTIEEVK